MVRKKQSSTTKKATRAPRKGSYKTASLPKGYEAITGFAPTWDFQAEPLLEGVVVSFGEVASQFDKGEMQRNCVIEQKDGSQVTVWESATLLALFENFAEDESVAIAFMGYGKPKKNQSPTKLFALGYK